MDAGDWKARARNYENESSKLRAKTSNALDDHPLLPKSVLKAKAEAVAKEQANATQGSNQQTVVDDPLSMMSGGSNRVAVTDDPLMMMMSSVPSGFDPLSSGSRPPMAPTSSNASNAVKEPVAETEKQMSARLRSGWDSYKKNILLEFTVSGNIKVGASFMKDVEFDESGGASGGKTVDRSKNRLMQLEADRGQLTADATEMSQNEYTSKIEELHSSLHRYWANDEKVASLKLAIKSSKMLGDTKFPQFYPSMFVMLTEILDSFGDLVFQRIFAKSNEVLPKDQKLKINFTSNEVPADAKETCRNWFYKTACIREILPRLYIEISLLRCYRFLNDSDFPKLLGRLTSLIRGIADPLVALYARCYLLRVGDRVLQELNDHQLSRSLRNKSGTGLSNGGNDTVSKIQPEQKAYVTTMIVDYLFSFQEFETEKCKKYYQGCNISYDEYLHLHYPAVQWIIGYIGDEATTDVFTNILHKYNTHCKSSMVLKSILKSFDGKHYKEKSAAMIALIKQSQQNGKVEVIQLFEAIGKQFVEYPPPDDQKLNVLNEVWKLVSRCEDLVLYVPCAVVWLDILLKHYKSNEVLILLSDLTNHISVAQVTASGGGESAKEANKLIDQVSRHIEHFVGSLISYSSSEFAANKQLEQQQKEEEEEAERTNGANKSSAKALMQKHQLTKKNGISNILTSESLHKLLDTFKSQRKVEICKQLLETVAKHQPPTSNPIFINTLFDMARTLHDSIDAMSAEGERKNITNLICSFIGKIDFKKDLEQQLNLFVECRAAFPNLDDVQGRLVVCVANLAMKAHKFMKGKHTKKTSSFVKGCLSYCHVTIPSVSDIFKRTELMLFCGQIALINQCLPQTDTFLKATISLLPDIPPSEEIDYKKVPTEKRLLPLIQKFLSLLVMVPGHPQHGPFYLLQGLLNAIPRFAWDVGSGLKIDAYVSMLPLLCAQEQRKLPYTIARVESNDSLYGGSADFVNILHEMRNTVLNEIILQLAALKEESKTRNYDRAIEIKVTLISLDVVSILTAEMESNERLDTFLVKMCEQAIKGKNFLSGANKAYYDKTLESACKYATVAAASGSKAANELLSKASGQTSNSGPL